MKNLIKINLKQKIWLTAILSLLFVLFRPLMQLMAYENARNFSTPQLLLETMEAYFLPDTLSDFIVVTLAAVSIGIVFFSYLFSKRKVDLYHSVPVNRKHLFISNYVSGIIIFVISQAIMFVISILIAIPNHYMTRVSVRNIIICIVCNFVIFLFIYGITICAVMLTGKIIVALVASAILLLSFPVVFSLFDYFMRYFYITFSECGTVAPTLVTKFYWLSPVTTYISLIERVRYEWRAFYFTNIYDVYPALIAPLIMAVLYTVAAFYLYLIRPSEACGNAIAFKKSAPVIRIPICIIGGLIATWFMCSSVNRFKNNWIWFGLVLGVILTHFALEIIINESFKSFISDKLQLIGSIAVAAIIVGIFFFDVTGFNNYLPKKENIKSASVYFGDVDNGLSCIEIVDNVEEPGYFATKYQGALENAFSQKFTDSSMIDRVYAVSQVGLSCIEEMDKRKHEETSGEAVYYTHKALNKDYDGYATEGYSDYAVEEDFETAGVSLAGNGLSSDATYEQALSWMKDNGIVPSNKEYNERTLSVQIYYELTNGKKVLRRYDVPVSKIKEAMNEVYKTEEFKKNHFDIYDGIAKGAIYKVDVNNVFDDRVLTLTESQKEKFLGIYMSELKDMTIDTISELPIGRVNFYVKTSERYDEGYSGYYIYKDFKKTLAYIESFGVDMSGFTTEIDPDRIMGISVTSYDLYRYDGSTEDGIYVDDIRYIQGENTDAIEEIAPYLLNSALIWSNDLLIYSKVGYESVGADLVVDAINENGVQRSYAVAFKDKNIPERLKKDIAIKIYTDNQF